LTARRLAASVRKTGAATDAPCGGSEWGWCAPAAGREDTMAGVPQRELWRDLHLFDPRLGVDRVADLLVEEGMVAAVGRGLPSRGAKVREGGGLWAFPGFVDLHVHLREPGEADKEGIVRGSLAAARGGFTAVVAMANTQPAVDRPRWVAWVRQRAHQAYAQGGALVWPCAALTQGLRGRRPTDAQALAAAGAVALSDDGRSVGDAGVLYEALQGAAQAQRVVFDHAEDPHLARDGVVSDALAARLGLPPRPAVAEVAQVARDIALAHAAGARLHVQHLSTRGAVEVVRQARRAGVRVTAEVTPHHLWLTEEDVPSLGGLARVNPPLRSLQDQQALWEAVQDGTVDALATDHAPHRPVDKKAPVLVAPPGIPGLETAVSLTYQAVRDGRLSLERFVDLWAYGPCRVLGRPPAALAEGAPVRITLFSPEWSWRVDPARFVSGARYSPWEGRRWVGRPVGVLIGRFGYVAQRTGGM
jgi:dihydroorotase